MIAVTRLNFSRVLKELSKSEKLAIDTETTGLHAFLGDRLFSIIIANKDEEFYFNWNSYPSLPSDLILDDTHKEELQGVLLSNPAHYWFMHKAIFDWPMLEQDGMSFHGTVHCTITGERVMYNEHVDYSLDGCGKRRKIRKDLSIENYIKEHKLYEMKDYNGYKVRSKRYDLVPYPMMFKYGCKDARVCYKIGVDQLEKIEFRASRMPSNHPTIKDCHANELKLQRTLHGIQMRGARTDRDYCRRAISHFAEKMETARNSFTEITGKDFVLSGKTFKEIFKDELHKCNKTPKGDYSFAGKTLESFEHPAAKAVVAYKAAKAKIEFFHNFIKFSDKDGFIHTEFKSYGTRTGRFSSASPNLQNLEKAGEEALKEEFVVRRAIIPRDGFFFAMIDYDQIEYRMFLDYARAYPLIQKVLGGLDVHTATAEEAGIERRPAKNVNFGIVYGQGISALATSLGVSEAEANRIRDFVFNAAPEINTCVRRIMNTADNRGHIYNWLGRVSYFPKRNLCYKAPNTLLQGGAGDVCKVAMNRIDDLLQDKKSNLLLNIHDEVVLEMHYDEAHLLPQIKDIMESVFPYHKLPLTCGIEWSSKSLADKEDFTGVDCINGKKERRDQVQRESVPEASGST